ncbi:outer membrane protein OmpA-like peptidoglycan-associated protein [Labrenzia sp. EL_126]|nr:outer membrane protein OmpA-like peptidoglycan-associated protein [Labrenzia sp. EL_126]
MKPYLVLVIFAIATLHGLEVGHSEEFSENEIVELLAPAGAFSRDPRGIKVKPAQNEKKPSINMRVQFEYNSDVLTTEALISLKTLGNALNHPKLDGFVFQIVGHTDAKGSDNYNMDLSKRRANAVREHLSFYYDVDAERLAAIGMGESNLYDASNPEAAINRRVEIKNTLKRRD